MKYYWVNQNQTFKQETEGGYMWSPLQNANGSRNQFYENMRLVEPGDKVFSFKNTYVVCIGEILSTAEESAKPNEFGSAGQNWSNIGWRVEVKYATLNNKLKPKEFISELRPTLPEKYSPLQENGNGNGTRTESDHYVSPDHSSSCFLFSCAWC